MKYSRSEIAQAFVSQADSKGVKAAIRELAALLLEQNMHTQVDEIIDDIATEYTKKYGVVEADVRTMFNLTPEIKTALIKRIAMETKAKKVILHEQIDRSLLGGVVVNAPDMELDLSLKTKLSKLRV